MKKILTAVFVGTASLMLRTQVNAYSPTPDILSMTQALKTQLNQITSGNVKDKRDYYTQLKTLMPMFVSDERLSYVLKELANAMYLPILNEKAKAKQASRTGKQEFLAAYMTGIKDISVPDNCTGRYNLLDTISFANNFPTALTMATRYRESNCGYYLPNNGDGPFQILSKDYGTGQINENLFVQTVQDFIDFSKAKRQQYKTKLGISLTYTGINWTGLINHSALYNGGIISGNIVQPIAPKYVYDGYGDAYSGATRYGVVPKFLKTLQWELGNTY
ncbi:MAG: hypothetical protein NTX91_01870 [candidate division SR1 bacterium]|nr:hypothetical protein [candidate division SR1 bacterium]